MYDLDMRRIRMQLILLSVIGSIYMMARSRGTETLYVVNIHKFGKGPSKGNL